MDLFFYFFVFILGTFVGSFLNVLSLRYNTGLSFVGGRSECFSCSKTLGWYELVPVFSFLFLRGRCLGCKSRISWQYPFVEMLSGLLFLGVFLKIEFLAGGLENTLSFFWITLGIIYLTIWSILLVIMIYDIRHKIIPDGLVYSFCVLALGTLLFNHLVQGLALDKVFWLDLSAGFLLFLPFFLFWFLSSGRLMGLGDAKLAVGMGFMLGLVGGIYAVIFAFWIGALWGISLILAGKVHKIFANRFSGQEIQTGSLTMKSEIPFAPFLILGTAISFFGGFDIVGISALLGI